MSGSNDEEGADAERVGTVSLGRFDSEREVSRIVDEEAGVVLYTVTGGQSAGLATVPLEETDLGADEWGNSR